MLLAFVFAISFVHAIPVFAATSDQSGPAIYLAEIIFTGRPVIVSGVGFTPSATIIFKIGGLVIETDPSPLVADSSGAFTALLMTGKVDVSFWTVTATDGKNTAQATLTITYHLRVPCRSRS